MGSLRTYGVLFLLLGGLLGALASPSLADDPAPGLPKLVWGSVTNADSSSPTPANITFQAYVQSRPGEVQTQASAEAGVEDNAGDTQYYFDASNFATAWAEGETIVIVVSNASNGQQKTVTTGLNADAVQRIDIALEVAVGAATKLAFIVQPAASFVAGAVIAPAFQVAIQDQWGNTVTTSSAQVALSLANNPGGASLSGTLAKAAVAGVATFSDISLNKVGTGYTFRATSTGLTLATSSAFNIVIGPAAKLAFTGQPEGPYQAGTAINAIPEVTVQDAQGNTVTDSTLEITVAIANNAGGGTLSGTKTRSAVGGVIAFPDLSIDKTGTGYTLSATATGVTAATSGAFNVTAAAAAKLGFIGQPEGPYQAGAAINAIPQVAVQDTYGNTVTSSTATITVALGANPGGGTLSGTLSLAATSGVAVFPGLSIDKAGAGYVLSATAPDLTAAESDAFTIVAAAAAKLAFTGQPEGPYAAGAAINAVPQVTVQDAYGNTVTTSAAAISVAIGANPGTGTLSGTAQRNAASGVIAFPGLSINRPGEGYTLCATATGLTAAVSNAFNIVPGAPAQLVFLASPASTPALSILTPDSRVAIQDNLGNTVTGGTDAVTVAITPDTGTSGAALGGTKTVAAVSGVATFSDLTISLAGTAFQLRATSGALAAGDSTAFNVTAEPALTIAKADDADPVNAGDDITYTITYGNTGLAPATGVTITETIPANTTYKAGSATNGGAYDAGAGTVTWNLADIPAQTGGLTVQFAVTVGDALQNGGTVTNGAYAIDCAETAAVAGTAVQTTVNDTVAPVTSGHNPAADAAQVPTDSVIVAHITDAGSGVDASTVLIEAKVGDGAWETLSDGSAAYDASGNAVLKGACARGNVTGGYAYYFQPSVSMGYEHQVSVRINASDIAGTAMTQVEYAFTTVMRSFGENVRVNSSASTHDHPATAVDSAGDLWVVWEREGADGKGAVYIAKRPAGETAFEADMEVNPQVESGDRRNPAIAIAADGTIYVAYEEDGGDPNGWDVYVHTATTATPGVWSNSEPVGGEGAAGDQRRPVIALGYQDAPHLAYQDNSAGNNDIYVAHYSGVGWLSQAVTVDAAEQTQPAIAVAPGGESASDIVYLLWTDARHAAINHGTDIFGASSADSYANTPVVSNAHTQHSPAVAAVGTASTPPTIYLHMVWTDTTSGDADIYYAGNALGLPGAIVTGESVIDDNTGAEQSAPSIVATGYYSAGNTMKACVAWQDARNVANANGDTDIYWAETGSEFGANVLVNDDAGSAAQYNPAIALDGDGKAYAVWADEREGVRHIYLGATTAPDTLVIDSTTEGNPIGPAGGAVTSGPVAITVPGNAIPASLNFAAGPLSNPPPPPSGGIRIPYEFQPSGVQFASAVRISIPVPADEAPTGVPRLYYWDTMLGQWVQDTTATYIGVDTTGDPYIYTFDVWHFTTFTIGSGAAAGGGGGGGGGCAMSTRGGADTLLLLAPWALAVVALLRIARRRKGCMSR